MTLRNPALDRVHAEVRSLRADVAELRAGLRDRDAVRAVIEAAFGVWIAALPDGHGWSDAGGGEVAATVRMLSEQPTHRIEWRPAGGAVRADLVRLVDDAAYTRGEWEAETSADWEVIAGEWRCQGQATPGGANGDVSVTRTAA